MTKFAICLSLLLAVTAVFAEPDTQNEVATPAVASASASVSAAHAFPSEEERAAERQRLDQKSRQIEDQYKQDMTQCYQKFDVVSCRLQARDRRIEAKAALRKEELPFKAMERHIKTEEAKQKLADRQSEAKLKKDEADRAEAIAAAKDRADANAQKQIDHALKGTKRGDYEQKQRDAAQHRADVEKKQRERSKEPAAPLPVPGR
jgi:colicin import membrane protein